MKGQRNRKGRISPPRLLLLGVFRRIDATVSVEHDRLTAVDNGNPLQVVLVGIGLSRGLVAYADKHLVDGQVFALDVIDVSVGKLDLLEDVLDVFGGEVLRRIDGSVFEDGAGVGISIAAQGDADVIIIMLVVGLAEHEAELRVAHLQALGEVGGTDEIIEVVATLGDVVLVHNV